MDCDAALPAWKQWRPRIEPAEGKTGKSHDFVRFWRSADQIGQQIEKERLHLTLLPFPFLGDAATP
jgi:hypothetical protein